MEKLALRLSGHYETIFLENKYPEGVILVQNETKNNYLNLTTKNKELQSEAINFSNLSLENMETLFKSNHKLRNDYFKFGLYNMLNEEKFNLILQNVVCPFSGLEALLEFVLKENKSLKALEVLIIKNSFKFTEKLILTIIKKILNLEKSALTNGNKLFNPENKEEFSKYNNNIQAYLISYLIKIKIDKKLFFTLLKSNKSLQFSPEDIISLSKILTIIFSKENFYNSENLLKAFINYFSICSDLLVMFSLQGKISKEIYDKNKLEFDRIKSDLREIEETEVNLKQAENLKLSAAKLQMYVRNISRDDIIIEFIKI